MLVAWLALASVSWAGTEVVDASLQSAQAAIRAGDYKAALRALDAAEQAVPTADGIVPSSQLAAIPHLRGVVVRLQGDRRDRALDHWRDALLRDPEYAWDTSLIDDGDAFSVFEALRGEVGARPSIDPGVPEALGAARAYVDGRRVRAGDMVLEGEHWAQITCDDATTPGVWTDFHKPLDWVALCSGGIDTSVVVADDEDELFGGIPGFGPPAEPAESVSSSVPAPPGHTTASSGDKRLAWGLTATGGGLLLSSVGLHVAWASPAWGALEEARAAPSTVTQAEADALSGRFQSARVVTLGTGLVGVGLLASGSWLHFTQVQVGVGPRQLVVSGRF